MQNDQICWHAASREKHQKCMKHPAAGAGDVNDSSGYSPFPGSINQLIIKLSTYEQQLAATGGVIAEFVNPKFKDAARTAFKKPTRCDPTLSHATALALLQQMMYSSPPRCSAGCLAALHWMILII
jgi:hypothetical protein